MSKSGKVNVVPCSGIGKPFGSVSRLAAYYVTEDDRPADTNLIPLALLVLGDVETDAEIKSYPSITLDGCKLQCAKKVVGECGGRIEKDYVVMDFYRDHKDLKPDGIAELNEAGCRLARILADSAVEAIDQSLENPGEESHA